MELNEKDIIATRREVVKKAYEFAKEINKELFLSGDDRGTEKYIYDNQILDALNIVNIFNNNNNIIVVSITKRTKVGMDGLMIEIANQFCTHPDDNFVINYNNVRFITGMSNKSWEEDFKKKVPQCFEKKIYHHGQLDNCDFTNLKNGLIVIDEIDSGDKETQRLHKTLYKAGITDVNKLREKNTKLIVVSATMLTQLKELFKWGDSHQNYQMKVPDNYISHMDFLEKGIIIDFKPIKSVKDADDILKEDIINKYKTDYRVHIIRLTNDIENYYVTACINNNILYKKHTSDDRLSEEEVKEYFKSNLTQHIVLGIKGFFRRANLIPNSWKLRIGAVHELFTEKTNISVQIQGLPGRMTGYWKDIIEKGHITGPYRTSIDAIKNYEKIIKDPLNHNVKLEISSTFIKPENFKFDPNEIINITNKSIPIKLDILDNGILEELKLLKGTKDYKKCIQILKSGIENKKIIMINYNNNNKIKPFSFDDTMYKKIYFRKCTTVNGSKNYRFDKFLNSHNKRQPYSQEIKEKSFSLDINYIEHTKDNIIIPKGLAFISYEQIPLEQNINIINEEFKENINISSEDNEDNINQNVHI